MTLLQVRQAALVLGVHENTLRRWEEKGLLHAVRLPSGVRRFDAREIEAVRARMYQGLPPMEESDDVVAVEATLDHRRRARPVDEFYWRRPWSRILFAGDLFEAIPFTTQPSVVVEGDDEHGDRKHYVGHIEFAYGLLITPSCDMADQGTGGLAHPYEFSCPSWGSSRPARRLARPRTSRA